jgi:serine/threonine-protein kinase SMG1
MKRASLCLNVSKMSTHLAELGSACTVPMPGQEHLPYSEVVSVHKMAKVAQVLPTKTRPKKIAFIGSDGKT